MHPAVLTLSLPGSRRTVTRHLLAPSLRTLACQVADAVRYYASIRGVAVAAVDYAVAVGG